MNNEKLKYILCIFGNLGFGGRFSDQRRKADSEQEK